jgi:hypothetical protein
MELFAFIDWPHIMVLILAALLRMFRALDVVKNDLKKTKEKFEFSIYWGDRWENWGMHIIVMILGIMFLPALVDMAGEFVPYLTLIKDVYFLGLFITAILGFAGYDAASWFIERFKKKLPDNS